MFGYFTKTICKQWIKLARKDLRRIKKKPRMSLDDARNIGQIEVEILSVDEWVQEATQMNTTLLNKSDAKRKTQIDRYIENIEEVYTVGEMTIKTYTPAQLKSTLEEIKRYDIIE